MTEMERVWYLVKERAEDNAERGLLVSMVDAPHDGLGSLP